MGFFFLLAKRGDGGLATAANEKREKMSNHEEAKTERRNYGFSLDDWAVAIALFLAALVRVGVLKHVPW